MTALKSFLAILRIIFVISTLLYITEAFYQWDGYAYFVRFMDFVPDASLVFVLWTILAVIVAGILWGILHILFLIGRIFLKSIRIEHVMIWFIIVVSLYLIKNYFKIDLHHLTGINNRIIQVMGLLLAAFLIWVGRGFFEKIPQKIDELITPLVWLFVFLFIFAVPATFYKRTPSESDVVRGENLQPVTSDPGRKRPNIILVTMDALTATDMQVYGYPRATTPFINQWASESILFTRAYSSSNWTTPGAMSIMTGQREWTHGLWYQVVYSPVKKKYNNNLPNVLKNYGYDVYGFVQNSFAHPENLGIEDAFVKKDKTEKYELYISWYEKVQRIFSNRQIALRWINGKFLESYAPKHNMVLTPPELVYNDFLGYSRQNHMEKSKPFFAWLHVFPPHAPYVPPAPYYGMFENAKEIKNEPDVNEWMVFYRKRYDEFILYSDKQLELFLLRLAENVDMSNTIVIFSSDHGESFSHGYIGHGSTYLYEPNIRIPLIIKLPGGIKGKIIDVPVEQIDIAPTILELADIPAPKWMEGRSLLPLIDGKPFERMPVFSAYFETNKAYRPISNGAVSVLDGDYKLIHYLEDKKSLLFNLRSDPKETQNIFDAEPEIAQRLMKLIDDNLVIANKRLIQYQKTD